VTIPTVTKKDKNDLLAALRRYGTIAKLSRARRRALNPSSSLKPPIRSNEAPSATRRSAVAKSKAAYFLAAACCTRKASSIRLGDRK